MPTPSPPVTQLEIEQLLDTLESRAQALGTRPEVVEYLRQQLETSSRESDDRFRLIFGQQFQFMAVLSPQGVTLDVSELLLKVTGVARGHVLGRPFWEAPWWQWLPEMREMWPGRLADAADADEPVLSEDLYSTADGSILIADASVSAVKNADGSVRFFMVQARDITDWKAAERALRDSEARFRAIFNGISDAAVFADVERRIWLVNSAFTATFGYSAADALGWTPEFLYADPADYVEQGRRYYRGSGSDTTSFEVRLARKDGSEFWAESLGVRIRASDGTVLGYLDLHRDITERKQAEEAKRESEERLRLAAVAEAASRAKSLFLAGVSHELRTRMTAIVGMTDLALAEEVSPTVHDHLQTARESADGLMEWLHELFHFSRLEAGRLELESVPFSLRRVVEHVTEAFRARAHEKGLKLVHDVPAQTPDRLQGDPARLGQVLVNLVRNAIDFTRRGRVTVAVREAALREEGSRIRGQVALQFSVADTGIGMAPEDRQRIFSPFLHSVGSTLGHIGGSGLGLGIARNLVELMGGRMWVESQPGQGSTFFFTVRLQRHLQDMPDAEEGEPSVSPMRFGEDLPPALGAARRTMTCDVTACAPESPAPPRMLRVLLADDAPTIRKLVAYVLGGRGHTVAMATDGREALDLLHQQDFDLVLMDVQMPEMDGFRATAEIRRMADRKKARVPIVAMTAHALHGDQQRCLAAGMDDYISKPMDSLELVQLVERLGASPPDVRVR